MIQLILSFLVPVAQIGVEVAILVVLIRILKKM